MTRSLAPRHALKALAPLAMIGLAGLLAVQSAAARAADRQVQVEVVGEGRPLLMVPGLNSSAEVWRETCAVLRGVQCHLVQLPGFAGAAPATPRPADFLPAMRDELLGYLQARRLEHVAVIGHSLGGVLALQMAIKAPQSVGPLVIVDSLPFYAAVQNPQATVQSTRAMAEQLRAGMLAADAEAYRTRSDAALQGMTIVPDRVGELQRWGRDSDRETTADAMYSMLVNDLREDIAAIHTPVLVLGAWAAYQPYGSTEASTRAVFERQYAKLPGVRIEMSRAGYHFLMWDDPQWLQSQAQAFLDSHP